MIKVETPFNCRWLIAREKPLAMPVLPKCASTTLKHNAAFYPHVSVEEVLTIPVRVAWIRHPIKRLYSCWCNFHRGNKEVGTGKELSSWQEFIDLILNGEFNIHWNPQIPQLTYNGTYVPTITERFENLPERFNDYLNGSLSCQNSSNPVSADLTYRYRELEDRYEADFEAWEGAI